MLPWRKARDRPLVERPEGDGEDAGPDERTEECLQGEEAQQQEAERQNAEGDGLATCCGGC